MTLLGPQFVRDKINTVSHECHAEIIKCMPDGTPFSILALMTGVEFPTNLSRAMFEQAPNEATHNSKETFSE